MATAQNMLEDVRDIFAILHDGYTSTWAGDKNLLLLKVDCEYLAERIDSAYKSFYIELRQIEKLEFHPWMNPNSLPEIVLTTITDIFKAPLEIAYANIENDYVKISCGQHEPNFGYSGGIVLLSCKVIKILDEGKKQLTIDEFDKISNGYWDEVSRKLEQSIIDGRNH